MRRTAEEAQEKSQERGEEVVALLGAVRTACSRLLAGVDPKSVCAMLGADVVRGIAPTIAAQLEQIAQNLSAPPIAPGGGGAPMQPIGASPIGMAQQGMGAPIGFPAMPVQPPPTGGATAGVPAAPVPPVTPGVVPG